MPWRMRSSDSGQRLQTARRLDVMADVKRYWGTDVASSPGSLSLSSLHHLVRQRASADQLGKNWERSDDSSITMETDPEGTVEEGLPAVTHSVRTAVSAVVHHKLPLWILQPRLLTGDISSESAPLSSVPLPPVICSNLEAMGHASLFPIQVQVLPELLPVYPLPPRDVCVCAPTGCGKTLCYVIPIVAALLDCVVRQVCGIVVVPSRTLARQVAAVFSDISAHTRVQCGLMCGECSVEKEALLVSDNSSFPASSRVDVVIVTPGRLAEHLQRSSFSSLHHLRFLVLDEADKLLTQQIYSWLPQLLQEAACSSAGQLSAWLSERSELALPSPALPPPLSAATEGLGCASQLLSAQYHVQKLLLSATMTQDPEGLALLQLHRPLLFSVAVPAPGRNIMSQVLPSSLHEAVVTCKASLKPLVLLHLISRQLKSPPQGTEGCVLCFTNSRESSQRLKVVLEHFNWFSVAVVTSDTAVRDKRRILQRFNGGEIQVIVCSDALARGMDMPQCSCVVNYDPPQLYHSYLHRVGRTARAGSEGWALSLLAREQVSDFHQMMRTAGRARLEQLCVTTDQLQPLQDQYEQALLALRNSCS